MGFEVRLTDIRGEPPLQVGEFLLDKDDNVLYVGSKDFNLSKNGGAEIGVMGRFIPIPPKRALVNIYGMSNIKINTIAKFSPLNSYTKETNIQDRSNNSINIIAKFTPLNSHSINITVEDKSNIDMKGSGNIVT